MKKGSKAGTSAEQEMWEQESERLAGDLKATEKSYGADVLTLSVGSH